MSAPDHPGSSSMRSPISLLWAGALAAGCAPGEFAWLPFPGDGSAASMILAVERGDELRLWAVPLVPRPETIEPPIAFGEEAAAVTALLLDAPLEEIGLPGGLLEPAGAPSRPLRELRFEAHGAAWIDGQIGAWTEAQSVGGAILEFPVPIDPRVGACPEFDQILIGQYPNGSIGGWGTLLVPLDGGGALAGQDDVLLHLGPDGTVLESLVVVNLRAGARTSTTILVIADSLYRAEVDPLRLTEIANLPAELGDTSWISAGRWDQIFTFGVEGSFGFFDGTSWRLLADVIPDGGGVGSGGALWLGAGEGAVLDPGSAEIARWDGAVHRDVLLESSLGFTAGTLSSTYGAVAIGGLFGDFYRYRDHGVWDQLPLPDAVPQVHALTDYDGGLAWGTGTGMLGFSKEGSQCEPVPVLEASEVYEICRLSDGLLVGYQDRNSDYVLIYFRPREK